MLLGNLMVRFWYTCPHLLHADSVLHIHRGSFVRRHSFSKLIFGFILTTYTQFITIFVISSSSANIHSPMNGCLRTGNNQFIVFIYNFNLNTVFILHIIWLFYIIYCFAFKFAVINYRLEFVFAVSPKEGNKTLELKLYNEPFKCTRA